jgi:type II secretory pathway pseudopilin PulG
MAALLVALAVMAVLMSVALPVWRHEAQREKEEELVFRGQQYVRAIRLFQAKNQTLPTSVDMLVQGRYIRKKFKDPITNEDFVPIGPGTALPGGGAPGAPGSQPGRGGPTAPGAAPGGLGGGSSSTTTSGGVGSVGSSFKSAFDQNSTGTVPGGMMGVASKSKDESIRLYQGRNHYNEWTFLFVNQAPTAPGGQQQPGGTGQQFPGRGGRGASPTGGPPFPGGGGFPGGGTGPGGRGGGPGRGVGPGGVPFPPGRGRL